MTKIERYAVRRGFCIGVHFDGNYNYDGLYGIFDKRLKYKYFVFQLKSEGDVDKQLRNNYKKIKKYVDIVYKWKGSKRIKYCTNYNLMFKGY